MAATQTVVVTPRTNSRLSTPGAHQLAVVLWAMERDIMMQERIQAEMNYQMGSLDELRTEKGYHPPVVEAREKRLQRYADFLNSLAIKVGIALTCMDCRGHGGMHNPGCENPKLNNGYWATVKSLTSNLALRPERIKMPASPAGRRPG